MPLELLLTHADDQSPYLDRSLPLSSAAEERLPISRAPACIYDGGGADPNDLGVQRWGVVAPEGPSGERLLSLVAPLVRAREEEIGAPVRIYRVPPAMNRRDAERWTSEVLNDEAQRVDEIPRYLLTLGDLDEVSLDFQRFVALSAFVGRLAFASAEGYEAYADKALRWERERARAAATEARVRYFAPPDGTQATARARESWIDRPLELIEASRARRPFPSADVRAIVASDPAGARQALLAEASEAKPAILVSLSHGSGPPRAGFASMEDERASLGALDLGGGERLSAADVARGPFLPGGAWIHDGSFAAGAPETSVYAGMLARLRAADAGAGAIDAVLAILGSSPGARARSFLGALPLAALANPDGPLAVIAPLDLAWSISPDEPAPDAKPGFDPIYRATLSLAAGRRLGVAYDEIVRGITQLAVENAALSDMPARGRAAEASSAEVQRKALLWLSYHELANLIVFGDPAVRLPISRGAA